MNAGERKFLSSQNLTRRSVFSSTDIIMMRRKRSYSKPLASEKQCTVPGSSNVAASCAALALAHADDGAEDSPASSTRRTLACPPS